MVDTRADAGWEPELEALNERRRLALQREDDERVIRHRAQGKLLVRERIERLLDPDSFEELGSAAGTPIYEDGRLVAFRPAGVVTGLGRIDGRRVVISGEDLTARGGPPGSGGGGGGGGFSK